MLITLITLLKVLIMSVIEKALVSGLVIVLTISIFNGITFYTIASGLNSVLLRVIESI